MPQSTTRICKSDKGHCTSVPLSRSILTGGTGLIGVALIKELLANEGEVTVVVRPGSSRITNIPTSDRIYIIECDLANLSSLKNCLNPPYDFFFHLGWSTESRAVTQDSIAQTSCIMQALEAVQCAEQLGCRVFVGAGSQAEYGYQQYALTPDTPEYPESCYGIAKYASGKLTGKFCQEHGLRHNWVRILSVYGPFDHENTVIMYCIRSLLSGQKPALTDCTQGWDFLYAADASRALRLIAEKGRDNKFYPLGSGQAYPLRNYIEILRDAIDPELPLGFGEKQISDSRVNQLCADISVLRQDVGFEPQYRFEDGIQETIEWARRSV